MTATGKGGWGERILIGWISLLLRAYPRAFRDRFGEDMEDTFLEQWRSIAGRGFWARAGVLGRASVSLIGSGFAERRRRSARGAGRAARVAGPFAGDEGRSPRAAEPFARDAGRSARAAVRFAPGRGLVGDAALAVRSLFRSPVFSVAALTTLALGIGATTSMFSVVNGVLLTPLPYDQPDRLVRIYTDWADSPGYLGPMSKEDLLDLEDLPAFDAVVGYSPRTTVLTGRGSAALVQGAGVTSGILDGFGLEPFLGRDLLLEESYPGSPKVLLVSHGFWMSDLGGDPDVLGTTLELEGEPYEIVGIAPPGFDYPRQARLWFPFVMDPEGCARGCHSYAVLGRMADGVSMATAEAQSRALAEQLAEAFPDSNLEKRFHLASLSDRTVGDVRQSLWILLGAVALVLLVACANVANLLLVRGQNRLGELGVRAALGAGRGRLVRQVLTESMVLAGLGGAAGLALAFGGVRLIRRVAEGSVPRLEEVTVAPGVVLFTFGLVLIVTVLFGLLPAVQASGVSPAVAIGRTRQRGSVGRRTGRARAALLAGEMALSVILLVGAGLLLRTLGQLNRVDLGYETENTLRFDLVLPEAVYPELPATTQFYSEALESIRRIPGVVSAGAGYGAPLGGWGTSGDVLVEGRPEPGPGEATGSQVRSVTPGYLETLGIRPLRGRTILASDDAGAETVAVVNETFLRQNFPGQEAMGERFRITISHGFGSPTWTIVGVVPDVRSFSLTGRPAPEVFVPQAQMGPGRMTVVVRSDPEAGPVLAQVREIVQGMDSDVPLRGVTTMEATVAEETASTRFLLGLLTVFSGLALVLAAVGLSGVVSYLVSQRRQEIGIRLALGANKKKVVRLVLEQAARPVMLGLGVGVIVSLAGARVMESLLFEVSPRDPLVLLVVVGVLVLTALVSAVFPARRAGSIDPVRALSAD